MIENQKFEHLENKGKKISRREFLKMLGSLGAAAFCFESSAQDGVPTPFSYEQKWYYTLEEIHQIYTAEYHGEKLLKNIIRKKNNELIGIYDNEKLVVPREFVNRLLGHFKDMLEQKAVKYLFRLDAAHGHMFVHEEVFSSRYSQLTNIEMVKLAIRDTTAGVLYHNAEHFDIQSSPEAAERYKKRNVIGWMDGRPLTILPLPTYKERPTVSAAEVPDGYHTVNPPLAFAAHHGGEFSIVHEGKEIRLDISLDDANYY